MTRFKRILFFNKYINFIKYQLLQDKFGIKINISLQTENINHFKS